MYKQLKNPGLLAITLTFVLISPATFAAFLGTGIKTKGVEITAGVKVTPGNAANQGAVAVAAQVTIQGPMWVFCANSPNQGTFSGNAGASIEYIDPAISFTSEFSVCEPTGGNTCGSLSISNIIGVGGTSDFCPNHQNWILVDGVPQFPTVWLTEIHCLTAPGGRLVACDADQDGLPDPGVYQQAVDELHLDCELSDAEFNSFVFGTSIPFTCTEL